MTISPSAIETVSGNFFDVLHPAVESIRPFDFAWAICRMPRYTGHTVLEPVYTVGQHSMLVEELADLMMDGEPTLRSSFWKYAFDAGALDAIQVIDSLSVAARNEVLLFCLLHDASEGYLTDLPTPIKTIPAVKEIYGALEDAVMGCVYKYFGIENAAPIAQLIMKWADRYALSIEAYHMIPSRGVEWKATFSVAPADLQFFHYPEPSPKVFKDFMQRLQQLAPTTHLA